MIQVKAQMVMSKPETREPVEGIKNCIQEFKDNKCLTSCSPVVRALVCQSSSPGLIPGMSRSESASTRGNPIMLLPPTMFL